jgi:hypothetical protein
MADERIPEEIVELLEAIGDAPELWGWWLTWQTMPVAVRNLALERMVIEMRANEEEPKLISAMKTLQRQEMFEAAWKTVQELYGS